MVRSSPLHHIDARDAALLMSGQRGGNLAGVLTVGPPAAVGGTPWTPFWVELRVAGETPSGGAGSTVLEMYAYALDENGDVDSYLASTATVAGSDVKLHDAFATSAAARTLRVLVRDRAAGRMLVAEAAIPGPGGGRPDATLVFDDSGERWNRIFPPDPSPASEASRGIAIDGDRRVPLGRPVVEIGARVSFFVVPWRGGSADVHAVMKLRHPRGMAVEAGAPGIVRATDQEDGHAALELAWTVPETDPGEYTLELSFADPGPACLAAPQSVIVVRSGQAAPDATWATLPAVASGDESVIDPIPSLSVGKSDGQLQAYVEALKRCAEGHLREGVNLVVALEASAAPAPATQPARPSALAQRSDDLLRVQATAALAVVRRNADALAPLLKLHHDVFVEWRRRGDGYGQAHTLRLIRALAEAARRSASPPAREAAGAVLASLADTVGNLSAPSEMVALLRESLDTDPESLPSRLGLAAVAEWLGNYNDAADLLRGVNGDTEFAAEGRLRRGINLLRTGDVSDGTALLTECTRAPSPAWIRVLAFEELAAHLLDTGRASEAHRLLTEAAGAFPDDQTIILLLAYSRETTGDQAGGRAVLGALDRPGAAGYSETPRMRYARWPAEAFVRPRRRAEALFRQHLKSLAAALQSRGEGIPGDES